MKLKRAFLLGLSFLLATTSAAVINTCLALQNLNTWFSMKGQIINWLVRGPTVKGFGESFVGG